MAQMNRGDEHPTGRELGRAGFQGGMSANQLLDDDHNRVLQLFLQFEHLKASANPAEKAKVAREIIRELKIHTQIEEEIYYPRMREKADIDDRVAATEQDHDRAEKLIRELEGSSTEGSAFDEKMHELHRAISDHITAERRDLFDVAEVMGINTPEIARRLYNRKQELLQERH